MTRYLFKVGTILVVVLFLAVLLVRMGAEDDRGVEPCTRPELLNGGGVGCDIHRTPGART